MKRPSLFSALFFIILLSSASPAQDRVQSPYFRNVAREKGLAGRKTLRCLFADFNGDGWPDVLLNKQHLFLNMPMGGDRDYVCRTEASGLTACLSAGSGLVAPNVVIAGDVDNDGDVDLFAAYYLELDKPKRAGRIDVTEGDRLVVEKKDHGLRSRILLNDGQARFSVLPDAGVEFPAETTSAAIFVDVNDDGILDLFTGNWYRYYGQSLEAHPDRLFQGRGDGTFIEITDRAGLRTVAPPGYRNSSKPTYGLAHTDWNNDGRQDLLVAVYGRQWNLLWENQGGTFKDVAARTGFDGDDVRHGRYPKFVRRGTESPFRSNGNTFDIAPCDFDNDGDVDVFLSEITHYWAGESSDRSCLLENLGPDGKFAFKRRPSLIVRKEKEVEKWNHGDLHAGWTDVNNDGLPDLILASSDYPDDQLLRLFLQRPDHSFEDRTVEAGFAWRNPTGISFADYDRDGDEDILVGNNNMRLTPEQCKGRVLEAALFENRIGQDRNFLSLRLKGGGEGLANRSAIGARVWVSAGGRVQMREVYGGGGHAGHQDDTVVHFGLGRAEAVDWIRVRWPSGTRRMQTVKAPAINSFLQLRQEGRQIRVIYKPAPRRPGKDKDDKDDKGGKDENF